MDDIADAAHVDQHMILPLKSSRPEILPIMPPPSTQRPLQVTGRLHMMGVADRDGQRIGGVRPRDLHAGQMQAHHVGDLHLGGMADADHRLLHRIRRIFPDREPACAGTSSAMARACPSFSVATASLLTKVCSTAAASGCPA
jgi:hypothetical protein